MPKYEFQVQKLSIKDVHDSQDKLNELGKKGFAFVFAATKDNFVYTILQKEKPKPGPKPKKKDK